MFTFCIPLSEFLKVNSWSAFHEFIIRNYNSQDDYLDVLEELAIDFQFEIENFISDGNFNNSFAAQRGATPVELCQVRFYVTPKEFEVKTVLLLQEQAADRRKVAREIPLFTYSLEDFWSEI